MKLRDISTAVTQVLKENYVQESPVKVLDIVKKLRLKDAVGFVYGQSGKHVWIYD